jgi:flagellar motor component MotA
MLLAFLGAFFAIGGKQIAVFFDLPSLIITVIFPIVFVTLVKGFSGLRDAFSIKINKDATAKTLKKAKLFFKFYGNITWLSCVVAIMLGAVNYFANAESVKDTGSNLALALVSILYSALVTIAIITPFTTYINEKINKEL